MPATTANDIADLLVLDEGEEPWTEEQVRAMGRRFGLSPEELDKLWEIAQGPIGP